MNDKEDRIKEQRVIEAVKKNLMGPSGKIGCIIQYLGEPLVAQRSDEVYFIDDLYEEPSEEDVRTMEDDLTYTIGYQFDGLSRGVHLDMKFLDVESEISVYFKGNLVYQEVKGNLTCFVPNDEWEFYVNRFYEVAHKKKLDAIKTEKKNTIELAKEGKQQWLQRMKDMWGF